jgi:hypothetical protein
VLHVTPGKKRKAVEKDGKTTVEMVDAPDTLQDWCGTLPLWAMRSAPARPRLPTARSLLSRIHVVAASSP